MRHAWDLRRSIPRLGRFPGRGHGNPLPRLAWRIPWTEKPGGLQSMGSQGVGHERSSAAHPQWEDVWEWGDGGCKSLLMVWYHTFLKILLKERDRTFSANDFLANH